MSASHLEHHIESGMYAPLLWQDEVLGVVCVDNCEAGPTFESDDLQLLLAVAHYAAMAVAHHHLQEDLRRESGLRANLLRQFSPQVAERLLRHRGHLRLGGERSEVTVLCSDVRGFTNLSQGMDPDDVVDMLNAYFARLIPVIFAHHGTVDKYVGDAILAVFGSPEPDAQHHENAVRAAVGMQAAMREVNAARTAQGLVTCGIGIGVHCGEVVHGFIGVLERMEFTVIGDAVNRAARYCDGAPPGEVLLSPAVYEHVWRAVQAAPSTIATKHEGDLKAYRLQGLKASKDKG
jgi:adenylate cyclase